MELKEVAAVSGKSGLFRVVKPTRSGVILETIDETKRKLVASANNRVSILKEISIYTNGENDSILLEEVFQKINDKYGTDLGLTSKSSDKELLQFIGEVVPEFDEERVYTSDIKKLVSWYKILSQYAPELISKKKEEEKVEKKPADKKPAAKKTSTSSKTSKPKADKK